MNVSVIAADVAIENTPLDKASARKVIFASSIGTVFEYYDFYLYGTLAVFFGGLFFPPGNERAALLASLATFGAGFGVRPLGALVFGRIGDLIGRKYTFLLTVVDHGARDDAHRLTADLRADRHVGAGAARVLAARARFGARRRIRRRRDLRRRARARQQARLLHELHSNGGDHRLLHSLGVIGAARIYYGPEEFQTFGWRVPFLLSIVLLGVSLYVRLKMNESPIFAKLKAAGKGVEEPDQGKLRQQDEFEVRAARAVRCHGRPGRRVVLPGSSTR